MGHPLSFLRGRRPLKQTNKLSFQANILVLATDFEHCYDNAYFDHRNRLENNSDHWNALLISLRELAEWAIAKEAELEAMGPIGKFIFCF